MQPPLLIYNSLTRQKEVFKPLSPPFVGLYLCGPTVYGKAHLGHARSAIAFDVVVRYLRQLDYKVRFVRNITDVGHLERDLDEGEDKVAKQARLEEVSPMEVAQRYTNSYRKNMEMLNVLPPSIEPCASGHIPEQIEMITSIIQKGLAYLVDGSVYFDVVKYNQVGHTYGLLSGRILSEMRVGTRALSGQEVKKNAADFALWKKATPSHIMRWPSPWGEGFPGWHIECTAIGSKYLGAQFDIHAGGLDLLFPHHECEIAQAQAACATNLATYWMHNNLVTIDGAKMGKSLGNFITLDEFFEGNHPSLDQPYSPMALRFCMLQTHYRSTLSFSLDAVKAAHQGYRKLMNGWYILCKLQQDGAVEEKGGIDDSIYAECAACYSAMNDDFNTAKVLASLYHLLKKINGLYYGTLAYAAISKSALHTLTTTYTTFLIDILGFKEDHQATFADGVEVILTLYKKAKAENGYDQVESIRSALRKMGVAIKDHHSGASWEYLS
ncbi:MAG: cysteine--tRNA ligase [Amoebophilaceae bacterium]|nr:cysteine--tRNA ligase [Amoebophilaceae bacterium]